MAQCADTIRVGQKLVRWDGERGFVALTTRPTHTFRGDDSFQVNWEDGESEYYTLASLKHEGVVRGKGRMRWAP